MARAKAACLIGVRLLVLVAFLLAAFFLFYNPRRDVPGPTLMPQLVRAAPPADEWLLTPHAETFISYRIGSPKRVALAPLPGGARLESRYDADDSCRVVRVGTTGEEGTVHAWHDPERCGRHYFPNVSVSPDGHWGLYALPANLKERVSRVCAFPLSGGSELVWEVPITSRTLGISSVFWRRDGTGWMGWEVAAVPAEGSVVDLTHAQATLWTADLKTPGHPARAVVHVTSSEDYPAVLGRTDKKLILAIDRTDARFTSRFRIVTTNTSGVARIEQIASQPDATTAGQAGIKPAVRLPLIAFDETQGVHVVRRTAVPVPPDCDSAVLLLSPDGNTLAWWAHTPAVYATNSPLMQQWDPSRFGKPTLQRYGAYSLWLSDTHTGTLRCIGFLRQREGERQVLRDDPGQGEEQRDRELRLPQIFAPRWAPDGKELLFRTERAGEYRAFRVSGSSVN